MPTMSVQYPITTNVDSIGDGFTKHASEFSQVYSYLNELLTLRASDTAPSGTLVDGEAYIDLSVSGSPDLKMWDDVAKAWRSLNTAANALNGGRLVSMFSNYTKNCKLVVVGTSLYIRASANVWAVAFIGPPATGDMYYIESDISLSFVGAAADTYYIFLKTNGDGFELYRSDVSTHPGDDYRYIGSVVWNGSALSSLSNVEGYNVVPTSPY